MVIIILGPSHVGKTYLAQKLVEKLKYPSFSIDHLKMGLIRSNYTTLTTNEESELTTLMWPIVKEMIKTAIENKQNMIVEGCNIPFNFLESFDDIYLKDIKYIALAMSKEYINDNIDDILKYNSIIEDRINDEYFNKKYTLKENEEFINGYIKHDIRYTSIESNYLKTINDILEAIN